MSDGASPVPGDPASDLIPMPGDPASSLIPMPGDPASSLIPMPGDPASGLFLIGRNSRGQWVVRDPSGLRGGLFVDRVHALKYAMSENGKRPRAVIMVPDVLELDLSAGPHPAGRASESYRPPCKQVA